MREIGERGGRRVVEGIAKCSYIGNLWELIGGVFFWPVSQKI